MMYSVLKNLFFFCNCVLGWERGKGRLIYKLFGSVDMLGGLVGISSCDVNITFLTWKSYEHLPWILFEF